MSFLHIATGTTYDQMPVGLPVSEFKDIGRRPSNWHYWDNVLGAWVEDSVGKAAAQARGW